jgi:pyruvate kinase
MKLQESKSTENEKGISKSTDVATDSITMAAKQVASSISAKALVCFTLGGSTVLRASKGR